MEYGFVFGGGGAKAYGQVGALTEILKRGYKPSYLAGTSMGAVNAVLLGAGFTIEEIYDFFKKHNAFDFFKMGLHRDYVLDNEKLGDLIQKYCSERGYKNLEDLPIKTAICVTDDKTNKPVFLTKGSIKEAVMATTAALYSKPLTVTDEVIKKQVCEQTNQEYVKGMHMVIKDGCYTINVPYEALDLLRDNLNGEKYFDICFDIGPIYKPTAIPGLNPFNRQILKVDRKRKEIFEETRNGVYLDLECGCTQTDFNKIMLNRGYNKGQAIVQKRYSGGLPRLEVDEAEFDDDDELID